MRQTFNRQHDTIAVSLPSSFFTRIPLKPPKKILHVKRNGLVLYSSIMLAHILHSTARTLSPSGPGLMPFFIKFWFKPTIYHVKMAMAFVWIVNGYFLRKMRWNFILSWTGAIQPDKMCTEFYFQNPKPSREKKTISIERKKNNTSHLYCTLRINNPSYRL